LKGRRNRRVWKGIKEEHGYIGIRGKVWYLGNRRGKKGLPRGATENLHDRIPRRLRT